MDASHDVVADVGGDMETDGPAEAGSGSGPSRREPAPAPPWTDEPTDSGLSGLAWEVDASDSELKAGDVLGRYALEELIGEGAFGLVFRATQTEPVRREVALKLLKLGMDTRRVVRRFRAERQMLSSLDHPGIARIYDAGASLTGRPYFVLEYVPGESITSFCDARRVSVDDRIRLMIDVCDAVQHVHQRGVIHRDLKPSNVLVCERVDGYHAKLIDLGVAKAMGCDQPGMTVMSAQGTEIGALLGTPGYMSPEQAGALPGVIDTRSDIYALGIMLCELLTGRLPIEPPDARLGAAGVRAAFEQEPRAAHLLIPTSARAARAIAKARGTDPVSLVRAIRGGPSWIIARCVAHDPEARYPSASELGADLRRYLLGERVLARPRSMRSRAAGVVRKRGQRALSPLCFVLGVLVGVAISKIMRLGG